MTFKKHKTQKPYSDYSTETMEHRETWWATYSPWGHKRVRHNLATKPPGLFRSKVQSISVMNF